MSISLEHDTQRHLRGPMEPGCEFCAFHATAALYYFITKLAGRPESFIGNAKIRRLRRTTEPVVTVTR